MSYENSYPFITGTLKGAKKTADRSEEEYANQCNELRTWLYSLQEEKKKLEERRDALKSRTESRVRTEEEIRDNLFQAFMNATWNAYQGIEKNNTMAEGMRQKEEAYEREYSQLMDEIAGLTKDKSGAFTADKSE